MTIRANCMAMMKNGLKATSLLFVIALYGCSDSDDSDGSGITPPADGSQVMVTVPGVRFTDCPFDEAQSASDLRCGVLDTYENYEETGPDARTVEVAFGIIPASSTPVAPDPIVVFIGGPGASALAEFALGVEFEAYTANRDLILVDQRGAGFSSPFLNCDFPNGDSDAEIRSCIANFEQEGVDLSQYRSAVIAQDFKVLREALEIPQWNVYGESYGPIPGVLYADLDPEGVRSVIFDSSTDNQVDIALADMAAPLDFLSEIAMQCAAETTCAARLPDLRSVFVDTFRGLMNDPWVGEIPGQGDFDFAGFILFDFIYDLDAENFPGVLEIFANRDVELLALLLSGFDSIEDGVANGLGLRAGGDAVDRRAEGANLMGAVVQCSAIDAENFDSAIIPTKEQWPDDLLALVREDVGGGYPSFCADDFVSIEQDSSQIAPRSLDVPALILGGGLDPIVSLQQVLQLTQSFTTPRLAIVPKGGHVVGFPETDIDSCVKGIVTTFLENPADAPEMACLTMNIEPFIFGETLIEGF